MMMQFCKDCVKLPGPSPRRLTWGRANTTAAEMHPRCQSRMIALAKKRMKEDAASTSSKSSGGGRSRMRSSSNTGVPTDRMKEESLHTTESMSKIKKLLQMKTEEASMLKDKLLMKSDEISLRIDESAREISMLNGKLLMKSDESAREISMLNGKLLMKSDEISLRIDESAREISMLNGKLLKTTQESHEERLQKLDFKSLLAQRTAQFLGLHGRLSMRGAMEHAESVDLPNFFKKSRVPTPVSRGDKWKTYFNAAENQEFKQCVCNCRKKKIAPEIIMEHVYEQLSEAIHGGGYDRDLTADDIIISGPYHSAKKVLVCLCLHFNFPHRLLELSKDEYDEDGDEDDQKEDGVNVVDG